MIEITNLTFTYGRGVPIFDGFDWQVEDGEAWAVIGPSGCGKSTLLYLLAGLRRPTDGEVCIAGECVHQPRPQTGLILQDHGLLPWATVSANARLGLTIRNFYGPDGRHAPKGTRIDKAGINQQVTHWLQRLGISDLAQKYPAQISGGQRQRTAIARTLVLQPDLLLMDEPFSALDAPTREDLQNLTIELRQEASLTTVIVTHNIEEAVFLGRRILVLRQPPNRQARIIPNPDAGQPAFRTTQAYWRKIEEVRTLMGMTDAPAA